MPKNQKIKNKRSNASEETALVTYFPQPTEMSGSGDYKAIFHKMANQIKNNEKQIKKALTSKPAKRVAKVALSAAARRFFGTGDYVANDMPVCNSLVNPTSAYATAEFTNRGRRGVRVVESECLGDIKSGALVGGSTVFTNQTFALNPANSNLFPWLSTIANSFDEYEPLGIIVRFKSTSSEFNGVSQALGTVILAADYDVADPPYSSKVEMENSDYAISSKSSSSMAMGIECDPKERATKLLFTGPVDPGESSKFYNLCNVQVATQGMSAADVTLGEIWIDYEFVFYKKQMPPATIIPPPVPRVGATFRSVDNVAGGASIAQGMVNVDAGSLDVSIVSNQLRFGPDAPLGRYSVVFLYNNGGDLWSTTGIHLNSEVGDGISLDPDGDYVFASNNFAGTEAANVLLLTFTLLVADSSATITFINAAEDMDGTRKIVVEPISEATNYDLA